MSSALRPRLLLKPAQLRLLHEIGESRQLQRAAEACAMTQPAASRMLAGIERTLGARLFLRQPTGMEPTEAGHAVLRRASTILHEMRGALDDVQALSRGEAGLVRIGAVTGPAVGALVGAVQAVKREAPEADITVDVLPSRELLAHLEAGDMDFILGRILPGFDSRNYDIMPIGEEKVSLLVRAAHPLAGARRVTLPQLAGQEWILQQRGAPIREATMQAFAGAGLSEPMNVVSTPSLVFTVAYLVQGDAIAPMSREVAHMLIQPPVSAGLATLALDRAIRVPPYHLLSLRRRPLSPLARRLRDCLLAGAPPRRAQG